MRKVGLYITAVMTAGIVMWTAPILSYAEPIVVEENTIAGEADIEDAGDTEEEEGEASPVLEAEAEEDMSDSGPDLAIQSRVRAEAEAKEAAERETSVRQNLVSYALQFVGGPYRAGGNDPRTGVDCSGFIKYVLQNGAGVSMNRSSTTQATQGVAINANQMQPGDLIFYGSGSRINHERSGRLAASDSR